MILKELVSKIYNIDESIIQNIKQEIGDNVSKYELLEYLLDNYHLEDLLDSEEIIDSELIDG